MMVNYQTVERGGSGWLRLLEFHPDGRVLEVRDYSPWLNRFNLAPGASFYLTLPACADSSSSPRNR